jgi:putative ABC transport system permease protein
VLTLALGIGATAAMWSVVYPVLIRALPYREPDRLVRVKETCLPKFSSFAVASGNFVAWGERPEGFEALAAYKPITANLTGAGEPERIKGMRVTPGFLELFGTHPAWGRDFAGDEDGVVMLSAGFWQRRFGGDPGILDRSVTLDDKSYQVVGIVPAIFYPVLGEVDFWKPAALTPEERNEHGGHSFHALGRLSAGASAETARASLDGVEARLEQQFPVSNRGWRVSVTPLHEEVTGNVRPALLVLCAAVAFLLLIACANVASLLLGRSAAREREIAVRAALGAGRGRILRQLAVESVLLSLLGGAAGLVVGLWGVDLLLALAPEGLAGVKGVKLDLSLVVFTFGISLLTGLVVAIAPAHQATRTDLNAALREGGHGGGGRARGRRVLVAVEVAACVVLLVGAGLLLRSFGRLLEVDPGFRGEGVLTVRVELPQRRYPDDPSQETFFRRVTSEVASLPGVRAVGAVQSIPFQLDWVFSFRIEGRPEPESGQEPSANYYVVTPEYFRAMGIRLVRGRVFTEQDRRDAPPVAIVNEKLARELFPGEDALGKRLTGLREQGGDEIVGIVADVKHYGLANSTTYQVYETAWQQPVSAMTLVVRGEGDPSRLAAPIRAHILAIDKDLPVAAVQTVDQIVSNSVSRQRFSVVLLSVFAALALLLAIVGIYGVISDAVTQRTRELGVRMALGARSGDVVRLMIVQGLVPALVGLALGLAGALAATRLMSSLLFGVSATDPATLGLVSAMVAGVAALACWVPARRATKVDPMVALRFDG